MSIRKFYTLGTASQVPTRKRNHNGYFLRWDDEGILFDPGEGTHRQMIKNGISSNEITKIFISHFHGDHCLGLPGIIQRLSLDQVQHMVDIYFSAYGVEYFNKLRNSSVYHSEVELAIHPIEKEGVLFSDNKFEITTKKLDHRLECWGFRIKEPDSRTINKNKLDELGLSGPIIGELKTKGVVEYSNRKIKLEEISTLKKGQIFSYVLDTRYCKAAVDLAKQSDLLVCESTFLKEHETEADERGHLTAGQAARVAKEAEVDLLVLTHFSQRYSNGNMFEKEAAEIHENVTAANDGDQFDFLKKREKFE